MISDNCVVYPNVRFGKNVTVEPYCIIGSPVANVVGDQPETIIGDNSCIRSHTVIYAGTRIGSGFQCGNKCNIRENCQIGDDVSVGTMSCLEHHVKVENRVRIHSQVFVPEYSFLGEGCWLGPQVVLTNARFPASPDAKKSLKGPVIEAGAVLGAASVLLPGVKIGAKALIGAGMIVTRDLPPGGVYVNPIDIRKISDRNY